MNYDLTDAAGQTRHLTMNLPAAASDGKIHVWLPIEEAVGNGNQYSFKPTFIGTNEYSVTTLAGDFNFPTLTGLYRGTVTPYNNLKAIFVAPK
jgi:hypothetical protein